MANNYSAFAASQYAALSDMSQAPNLRQIGGNVHYLDITKTYTAEDLPATADPLYLVRLPKGARLILPLCSVDYEDPGDALTTSKIGYIYDDATGDDDAFGVTLTLGNAAGRKLLTEATGTKAAAFLTPVTFTDDAWVYVTWATVTSPAAHKQVWHLAYTLA